MSEKSLKSYDEFSDVFEKSYSEKSGSDDSSCDDEDETLARELMKKMTPAFISKLRRCFKKKSSAKDKSSAKNIDRKVEEVMRMAAAEEGIEFSVTPASDDPLSLDERAFVDAVNSIFGHYKYSTHAQKLFRVLDPYNAGRARWRQLVSKLEAVGAKKTGSKRDRWNRIVCADILVMDHCKRETIVKIVNIEREDTFCYAVISKGGRVGIYDGYLKHLQSYELFYHRTGLRRRAKNCWITDAIYLKVCMFHLQLIRPVATLDYLRFRHFDINPYTYTTAKDVQYLMISASDRSLTVYDVTTLSHTPLYCVTGMPNIPTCLAYSPTNSDGTSELAIGTERGDVVRITFLQPRVQLIYTKQPDSINYYFWMELSSPPHTSHLTITIWRRMHSRSIRRIAYAKDGDMLLSCSHDSGVSVRARHVPGKLDDYVFKVQRGISCFHAVYPLHLLVTGSPDGVRLWETSQAAPFAVLPAPAQAAVLDVAVVPAREVVVAFCNNCSVHVWDIYEECLLQTIKIKFPFLGVLGKKLEFGTYCIHPGPLYKDSDTDRYDYTSRRGSSVMQAPTGGLMLMDPDIKRSAKNQQPEYTRFNRSSLLITACSHVSVLSLGSPRGTPPPPPGDTLAPRRPSAWDLPDFADLQTNSPAPVQEPQPSPRMLEPATAEYQLQDLDELLENAGLQGILEKDFSLMQGLKHDLNKKLAAMDTQKETMRSAVIAGAPYLSLNIYPTATIDPVDEMMDEYKRVLKLFPGASVAGTPASSEMSTPRSRNRKNSKL